ncbi:DMT family transporter [Algicola sagamiensis]|uniref:DMT family transporter n=1 Tax=Algicola sagamiensis TaxID=163869 RepID=UPI0003664D19|nr:DMT family transporter [Algicola sagamiensis]
MSGLLSPVQIAMLILVIGNIFASFSDVAVKMMGGEISPFQYIFFRQCICVLLLFPIWKKNSAPARAVGNLKITLFRAHLVIIGSCCMVVALTYLSLATANAIFYAAPLLMIPLSFLFLGERPPWTKVFGTLFGFMGVIIVLRPSQFHWAALFALGCATTLALFHVCSKKIPQSQPVVTTLFWTSLLSLPVSLGLAVYYWQPMDISILMLIVLSSLFTLGYHGSAVAAYRRAPATHISIAEYTGLIFVALIGVIGFDEVPDALTWLGIAMIILPMLPMKHLFYKS